ncbi:MAG TPA: hypothetical protein VHV78_14550, partial [Gemmatimonadaceae bacterium]|nr:hypothetical protein [Gemmatimonadaceae bacterium]
MQLALAMTGVIGAAYVALHQPAVAGLSGLLVKIDPKTLSLLPDFNDTSLTLTVLVIPLTIQWWSAMLTLLPAGMKGLLVASLFAAYRSTMETHLNWGSSYLIVDFYRRFVRPDASERHYLWVSR